MKNILIVVSCMAFFAAITANCLDLTLNDGTVFKNVIIFSKTIDGIDVESHKDNDVRILRHVMYKELSPGSLKLFPEYDKAKSDEYLISIHNKIEAAIASDAEKRAEWEKMVQARQSLVYPAFGDANQAIWLVVKSTKELDHGTIGWGSTEAATGPSTGGHLGKIYVYGLKITAGNEWAGKLYLTNRTMQDETEGFPCYTTSPDLVNIVNNRTSWR